MQLYTPIHDRFERYCKTRAFGEFHFKDIMHDTLVVAFEKFDKLKSREAFLHFLFGIASRILANQRKKKKPEYVENLNGKFEHVPNNNISVEQQLEISELYKCIALISLISSFIIMVYFCILNHSYVRSHRKHWPNYRPEQ